MFLLFQFSEHLAVGGTVLHRELTDQFAEGINLCTYYINEHQPVKYVSLRPHIHSINITFRLI